MRLIRTYVTLISLTISCGLLKAQEVPLTIVTGDKSITLNEFRIDKKSTIQDVKNKFGPETRIITKQDGSASLYIYDSLGINFIVKNSDSSIKKVDFYFTTSTAHQTSPGDIFSNSVVINGGQILKDEPIEQINKKTGNMFKPLSKSIPWFVHENDEFMTVISYEGKEKLIFSTISVLFQRG